MVEKPTQINPRIIAGARRAFASLPPEFQKRLDEIYPYVFGWVRDGLEIEEIRNKLQEQFPLSLNAFDTFIKPPKKSP
jgi:hypothetical protein